MLVEQNVTMIISTCKTVELGRQKCNRFWPKTTAQAEIFNVSQSNEVNAKVEVKLVEEK